MNNLKEVIMAMPPEERAGSRSIIIQSINKELIRAKRKKKKRKVKSKKA